MTTLEESKNEVALKNGWNDWDSLVIWHHESGLLSELWEYIDEVAQEAAKSERNKTIEEAIEIVQTRLERIEGFSSYTIEIDTMEFFIKQFNALKL